ncbi:OsmC family protein [Microbacterium capsulatum]|uniref:OsmC family protein n=1 Tax=Microbacterium capsulatum TaxID=3041921 RepID=A0ABU0XL17_9MICO|nr:OsmC family protein [Microbacterium sp. ASV81]MDQ4215846.1 OsmC family protein [Microbacterium sp. ASV81]
MSTNSEVRDRQRPLRILYREHPAEAISRKWAGTTTAGAPAEDPFHGVVRIGRGYGISFRYGLDRGVGGLHDRPNPGDMLCAALAACLDSSVRMIANSLGIELAELAVEVDGDVDLRGTLMVDPDVPVGFQHLACTIRLRPAADPDERRLARLIELAEQCCVNLSTLRAGVDVQTRVAGGSDLAAAPRSA